MNEEIKNLWVEALRSGKYKQGQKRLKSESGDKFCCLGVLCDISGQGNWNENNHYLGERGNLPNTVMRWADMNSAQGVIEQGRTLIMLNDVWNYSFEEIADEIENHWKDL